MTPGEALRILVVEDNPSDARLLEAGLRRALPPLPSFTVAPTLAEAVGRLAAGGFDVVLLDLSLPDSSGLAGLRALVAESGAPPIVVLTGTKDGSLGLEAVELGAEDYIEKDAATGPVLARIIRYAIARHRIAADLRRSQELLDAVTQGAETIVAIVDPELRLLFLNSGFRDAVLRHTGRRIAAGDLLTEAYEDQPLVRAKIEEDMRRTLAGEGRQLREEFGDPGRYLRLYNVRHTPIRDDAGKVVAAGVIAFDVTEQQATERALSASEERLRLHVEGSPLGIVEWDADFVVTRWTGEAERIFGWSAAETVGRRIDELRMIHEEDLPAVEGVMASLTDGATRSLSSTNRNLTKDGRVIHCEWNNSVLCGQDGKMLSVLSEVIDITSRVRAESDLVRLADRHSLVAAAAGELLRAHDPAQVVNRLCRRAMRHLDCQVFFNYLVDEKSGDLRLNAWSGITREQARRISRLPRGRAVCGCMAGDGLPLVAEHIGETPDPHTDLVRSFGVRACSCNLLVGTQKRVLGTLSFGTRTRDAFEAGELDLMRTVCDLVAVAVARRQAENALRAARDGLEARVAERTRELRRVSSELVLAEQHERERLAAFLHDHLQQVLAGAKLAVGGLRMLPEARAVERRLGEIEDQLAAAVRASRSLTGEIAPPVLSSRGLPAALEWLASHMHAEHRLQVTVIVGEWKPLVDEALRVLLFQSVKELLFNVVKHAGVERAEVEISRRGGGDVLIEIRDRGRGFDPAERENAAPGTFGLWSVAERVGHAGGVFEIESSAGRGTTARIRVPEQAPAPQVRRRPGGEVARAPAKRLPGRRHAG